MTPMTLPATYCRSCHGRYIAGKPIGICKLCTNISRRSRTLKITKNRARDLGRHWLYHARVVVVEPTQRVRRAVGRPAPLGVTRLLGGPVAHMKAGLVRARHILQASDARQA